MSSSASGALRRALPYAYQGALVAAALIALPPTGSVYESRAILELEVASPSAGAPSPLEMVEEYALKLVAESGKGLPPGVGCAGSERRADVLRLADRKLQLTCRADVPGVAQRRCDALVGRIARHFEAFEIAGRARAAVKSITSRLLALTVGLGLGLAWVFLRVHWTDRRNAAGSRASQPAGRISSPRPVVPIFRPSRTEPGGRTYLQPIASARPAQRKQPLDRTIMGHGAHPTSSGVVGIPAVKAEVAAAHGGRPPPRGVLDTTAESQPALAPYETTSRWAPDPALGAAATRAELRALCDQLYLMAAKGCFVLRVSSDPPSSRLKSHVSAQLAWSLADFGQARVLLLEADFDDPGVHHVMRLNTPPFKGFSQQLYQRMISGERAPWSVARCAPCLSVLAEGRVRTPGLVHTAQFSTALAELRRHYDIIVVDGPAADSASDTRALDGVADGVVFAVTSGVGASEGLAQASELFGDKSLLWIVHTHADAEAQREMNHT